jgi:hypothetical protein
MHRKTFTLPILFFSVTALLLTGGLGCSNNNNDDTNTSDDDNFREDVFQCENAVAHAATCCPGLAPPPKVCVHHFLNETQSCGCSGTAGHTEEIEPVWDVSSSTAIATTSCEELAANDGCSRLPTALAKNNDSSSDTGSCSDDNNNNNNNNNNNSF